MLGRFAVNAREVLLPPHSNALNIAIDGSNIRVDSKQRVCVGRAVDELRNLDRRGLSCTG